MCEVGQSKDEVPLLSRVEISVGDCQSTEGVTHAVLSQGFVDLSGVHLGAIGVLSDSDFVVLDKVAWYFLSSLGTSSRGLL